MVGKSMNQSGEIKGAVGLLFISLSVEKVARRREGTYPAKTQQIGPDGCYYGKTPRVRKGKTR